MVASRTDLAIVAVVAMGMIWIEHGHRIVVATPAVAEVAQSGASLCPATDDVPFSADCIKFIDGGVLPDNIHPKMNVLPDGAAADMRGRAESHVSACPPSNENAPYSAACIRFMSGWFWQADAD